MGQAHACLTRQERLFAKEHLPDEAKALENPNSFQLADVELHVALQYKLKTIAATNSNHAEFKWEDTLESEANLFILQMAKKHAFYTNHMRNVCNYFDLNWTYEQSWYGKGGRTIAESESVRFNRYGKNKEVFKNVIKKFGMPDDFVLPSFIKGIETENDLAKKPWG